MSANNSVTLTTFQNWRNRDEDSDYHQRRQLSVPQSINNQQGEGGGMYLPWRVFEDRVRTGPFGLARFPSRPHSPAQIFIIEGTINGERAVNPSLLRFIHDSPPRIRTEWQLTFVPDPEPPALTDAEFKTAMKKLRKQTYDPPQPRRRAWKRGLFGNRNSSANHLREDDDEKKEEDKLQCVICLESFVAKEQVMATPCNHMFHGKCVVPWVRSHGRCPVCRSVLCERKEETVQAPNHRSYSDGAVDVNGDDLALELMTLVRAMEEAFMWMHLV